MLTLKSNCRVAMITFGGKQNYTAKKGETFLFNYIFEQNDSYLIVYSGLNCYVFETNKVEIK